MNSTLALIDRLARVYPNTPKPALQKALETNDNNLVRTLTYLRHQGGVTPPPTPVPIEEHKDEEDYSVYFDFLS